MNLRAKEFGGGIVMLCMGLLFLSQAITLPIGSWNHPGPGALPTLYASCLASGGAFLIWRSGLLGRFVQFGTFDMRGTALLFGAFIIFALLIRPLGLLIAAPGALILAYLAARGRSSLELVSLVVGVTAGSVLLFIYLLGLPIPLFSRHW